MRLRPLSILAFCLTLGACLAAHADAQTLMYEAGRIWPPVRPTGSARAKLNWKYPLLRGRPLVLVGFKVRHGDIIDAITPIFAEIKPGLRLKGEYMGVRIGGKGGGETVLRHPGYVVTGLDIWRGAYFGRDETIHLQVRWQRLDVTGLAPDSEVLSEKLGSGNYAQIDGPPKFIRAKRGSGLNDLIAKTSWHTSGELFLHDLDATQRRLHKP